jgi:hypothetical protein
MGVKQELESIVRAVGGKTHSGVESSLADLSASAEFVAAVEIGFAEYASNVPSQERLAGARELANLLKSMWAPKGPRRRDPAALLPDTQ